MSETLVKPRTSQEWWDEVKADDQKLIDWLEKQYHGEVTAAGRIEAFAATYVEPDSREARILRIIAGQENTHAAWVGDLLTARGVEPVLQDKEERYWNETIPAIGDFATGAAVAARAEHMRLDRIRTIAEDESAPADIRGVFQRILPQELFHERAFTQMAGSVALQATAEADARGHLAIGLFPEDM